MKLFGNKRNAAHLTPRRLTGLQRGLIGLAVCLVLLGGASAVLYTTFVQPPEIAPPEPVIREPVQQPIPEAEAEPEPEPEQEVFAPPTVVQIETKVDEETGEEITVEVEVPASHKEDFYNILLVGTDDEGLRTDTIMIGRLDTKDHTVALLSVPRDTLITGSYAVPKINSVYAYAGGGEAGIEALRKKLSQTLGFEVDGYALINLDAFVELVDLVDGVEFDVPMDMDYEDPTQDLYIHLKKGVQTLDGQKAMQLVRYRKGYLTQDIQRTQVQQQFLQALAKKCLSVVNLGKIGEMARIFKENVTTDLTLGNLAYFGQELLKCDFENMFTHTLQGEAVMVKDASCYAIYRNKTLEVVNTYFNPYETDLTAANVTIRSPEDARAEQAAWEAQKKAEEEAALAEQQAQTELPEDLPLPDGDFWAEELWPDEETLPDEDADGFMEALPDWEIVPDEEDWP